MRIIIDNSNLFAGGGIQVATSFLSDLRKLRTKHTYLVVLSPNAAKAIPLDNQNDQFQMVALSEREYSNLGRRSKTLQRIEKQFKPDVVFVTFGPSYFKSKVPKIVGFAIPHLVYPDSPYFTQMSLFGRLRQLIKNKLKRFFFIRNSDILIFETGDAAERFSVPDKVSKLVVSNTLNSVFESPEKWIDITITNTEYFNILFIAANYPHKNIDIITDVIDELLARGFQNFQVLATLEPSDLSCDARYDRYIQFIGRVAHEELPSLYKKSKVVLITTMLEVFSATYLEAMFMEVPIICSDFSFARYICGDGAIYCNYSSADKYAEAIIEIASKPLKADQLKQHASKNLIRFGTSRDRSNKYLDVIESFSN